MINVLCRLDEEDMELVSWPMYMCGVPNIGDAVESTDGKYLRRVADIKHIQKNMESGPMPLIIVELEGIRTS